MPGPPRSEAYRLEFLPQVQEEVRDLSEEHRRRIAELVLELRDNPWMGESMDDRWPENLAGCRKIGFDTRKWRGKPRFRLVYRNEPSEGAVAAVVVLAIGRRDRMIAYSKASTRLARRQARDATRRG